MLFLESKTTEGVQVNDVLKLIDKQENMIFAPILEKGISSIVIGCALPQDAEETKVFVYGKQVDDFHVLEKQAIFSVGIAALQRMNTVIQRQKHIIDQQHSTIMNLHQAFKELENESE